MEIQEIWGTNAGYNPERDGPIESYIKSREYSMHPVFKGHEPFEELWKKGYLIPRVSAIRVLWNIGREDEHFRVINDQILLGIQLPAHSGREGYHSPIQILNQGILWEAQSLAINPIPRQLAQPNLFQ